MYDVLHPHHCCHWRLRRLSPSLYSLNNSRYKLVRTCINNLTCFQADAGNIKSLLKRASQNEGNIVHTPPCTPKRKSENEEAARRKRKREESEERSVPGTPKTPKNRREASEDGTAPRTPKTPRTPKDRALVPPKTPRSARKRLIMGPQDEDGGSEVKGASVAKLVTAGLGYDHQFLHSIPVSSYSYQEKH